MISGKTKANVSRVLPAAAVASCLLVMSCSEETVGPRRAASQASSPWTWLNPAPLGANLLAVWGSSPTDIYAVGERGAIVHFDGSAWSAMPSGTVQTLRDVMGSSSNRIWAVGTGGTVLLGDGRGWTRKEIGTSGTLASVWACRNGNVYACGLEGLVLKNDGWSWSVLSTVPARCIWADEGGDVFTAGYYHQPDDQAFCASQLWVDRYDGFSWGSQGYYCEPPGASLEAIWGSGPDDVYVAGRGMAVHFDGQTYGPFDSKRASVLDIWGISATDIFAVGSGGAVIRYDGSAWNLMSTGMTNDLSGVWGSSGSDVYAVGSGGFVQHYDGASWTAILPQSGTRRDITDIWGVSDTECYVVGPNGLLGHYDGSACSVVGAGTAVNLNGVWASSPADVYAVGANGTILHGDGSSFGPMSSPTTLDLWDLHGASSTDIYAAAGKGAAGAVLHFDGALWSTVLTASVPLYSVWEVSPAEVYAVGTGVVYSFDGSEWTRRYEPLERGLWARGTQDVYSIGRLGVFHFDGTMWTPVDPPQPSIVSTRVLSCVWGRGEDIYAAGPYYDVLHYDGSAWEKLQSPSIFLDAIWGSSSGDILFAGSGGAVLGYRTPE